MDTEATRELVEQFNIAWVNNDGEAMAPLTAEDIVQSYPPHPEGGHEGREAVIDYITGASDSTADMILKMDTMVRVVHKLVVDGDTAVGFHKMSATLRNDDPYSNEYIWRYTCADGKVVRLDGMVDRSLVEAQLGPLIALLPSQQDAE